MIIQYTYYAVKGFPERVVVKWFRKRADPPE